MKISDFGEGKSGKVVFQKVDTKLRKLNDVSEIKNLKITIRTLYTRISERPLIRSDYSQMAAPISLSLGISEMRLINQ